MNISYPADLPVSARREEIAATIRDHQVVILAGETGSGKTTQLPKICLELGRKLIGHTQPRRIAARNVSARIADELGAELGGLVGYQVRFTAHTSPETQIKVMTDGILLAELQHDRQLKKYDTIIIDEAHERSLNIDFLLGYLKQLLPRRPDLKLIVTSATIDTQRFAQHFANPRTLRPAPIIEVSGRTYPVEVRYRPLVALPEQDDDGEVVVRDQTEAIVDAVRELCGERPLAGAGDVLVFLPGEREIKDTAEALLKVAQTYRLEVLPLFGRLSAAEQQRVFSRHDSVTRRVVLATNVAETSLTVPGIRYVVDSGVARVSRYSARSKVQRLPIEPISQASANQRAGRCGRLGPGIAIRLYSEEDFAARPEFTEPEVLRTNLASVILQMLSLKLGALERFPFIQPPDRRQISAGWQLLTELNAVTDFRLTKLGRRLAKLPIDPRLGRMILAAEKLGCVREVIVIAAALSVQDPRERPQELRAQADQAHARFKAEDSDFLTWLNLWRYLKDQQKQLSSSKFRKLCRAEHLNYLRVREWQDFESQLRQVAKEMRVQLGHPADRPDADGIHQALLSGLLSQIGALIEREPNYRARGAKAGRRPGPREYDGARGTKFAIFPGSALKGKNPPFLMAGELVETSRLWARQCAGINPEWAERLAGHLVTRSYSEPHWSSKRAAAMAFERVQLYGVTLVADRKINFGSVDPVGARELFIRHALVAGEWRTHHKFYQHNQELLDQAAELEHRARRRDIVVDEETLVDFYAARLPTDIVSGAHFDTWWKEQRRLTPELLNFDLALLTRDHAASVSAEDFPTTWQSQGWDLPLTYHFEPGAQEDGVTVDVPLATLNQLADDDFSWHVPGLREELVTALIRGLPKPLRVNFVPAPQTAREFLATVPVGEEPLLVALERYLVATTGVSVPRTAWPTELPAHLQPTFRLLDEDGTERARGKDLAELKAPLADAMSQAINQVAADAGFHATGAIDWSFGELPESFVQTRAGHQVQAFPAVVDEGQSVGVRVFASRDLAQAAHRLGVRRLLGLAAPFAAPRALKQLSATEQLGLAVTPYGSSVELAEDVLAGLALDAVDQAADTQLGVVRDREQFAALVAQAELDETRLISALSTVAQVLAGWREIDRLLSGRAELSQLASLTQLQNQLHGLVHSGFVGEYGVARLAHYPRYFAAMKARHAGVSDQRRETTARERIDPLQAAFEHRIAALSDPTVVPGNLRRVRWLLEEYRVSLWAQQLGTAESVSDQRIRRALG